LEIEFKYLAKKTVAKMVLITHLANPSASEKIEKRLSYQA